MWPELEYAKWKETLDTLHMWMQIVGKVKLELSPFLNQWWEVAFSVTSRGMTTGLIPYNNETFQVDFDFQNHTLSLITSGGETKTMLLKSQSVASFYDEWMNMLKDVGITVRIWPVPVEIPHPIPFEKDTQHASYDKEYVTRWWQILSGVGKVLEKYKTSFRGKSSPTHFFWGSFDITTTRFSGKFATPPNRKGVMGKIMHFAENEENYSAGFWPGDERFPHAALYAYIYPAPKGYELVQLTEGASFNEQLSECILPYDSVRKTKSPQEHMLHFFESTYAQSARLAGWDIEALQTKEVPRMRHK